MADPEIQVDVSGAGELIALGSADPLSEEPYVAERRRAYQGRLLAIVRTVGDAGAIHLQVLSAGLPAARITLQAEE